MDSHLLKSYKIKSIKKDLNLIYNKEQKKLETMLSSFPYLKKNYI